MSRAPVAKSATPEQFYTPQEVAELCRLHPRTIYEDIHSGRLKACRRPGGRLLKVKASDVARYQKAMEVVDSSAP